VRLGRRRHPRQVLFVRVDAVRARLLVGVRRWDREVEVGVPLAGERLVDGCAQGVSVLHLGGPTVDVVSGRVSLAHIAIRVATHLSVMVVIWCSVSMGSSLAMMVGRRLVKWA
jgi:hypothetical protein